MSSKTVRRAEEVQVINYNDKGEKIEIIDIPERSKEVMIYDPTGTFLLERKKFIDGGENSHHQYFYDKNGKISFSYLNNILEKFYEYDEFGRIIKLGVFCNSKKPFYYEKEYDSRGNVVFYEDSDDNFFKAVITLAPIKITQQTMEDIDHIFTKYFNES